MILRIPMRIVRPTDGLAREFAVTVEADVRRVYMLVGQQHQTDLLVDRSPRLTNWRDVTYEGAGPEYVHDCEAWDTWGSWSKWEQEQAIEALIEAFEAQQAKEAA